jgi:hypothetical protein
VREEGEQRIALKDPLHRREGKGSEALETGGSTVGNIERKREKERENNLYDAGQRGAETGKRDREKLVAFIIDKAKSSGLENESLQNHVRARKT